MDEIKVGCIFCHSTGKVSQTSNGVTRTETCFMCRGRGFSVMTIRNPNQSAAVETISAPVQQTC
jgi:hypothetical protein